MLCGVELSIRITMLGGGEKNSVVIYGETFVKKLSVLSRPYLRRLSILPFSQMSTNFFLHSKRFTWLSRINCTESSPFYLDQRTWLVQDYAASLFCENVFAISMLQ